MKKIITKDNLLSIILIALLLITLTVQIISCTNTPAYADSEPTMPTAAERFNIMLTEQKDIGINPMKIYVITDIETAKQYMIVKTPSGVGVCPME